MLSFLYSSYMFYILLNEINDKATVLHAAGQIYDTIVHCVGESWFCFASDKVIKEIENV